MSTCQMCGSGERSVAHCGIRRIVDLHDAARRQDAGAASALQATARDLGSVLLVGVVDEAIRFSHGVPGAVHHVGDARGPFSLGCRTLGVARVSEERHLRPIRCPHDKAGLSIWLKLFTTSWNRCTHEAEPTRCRSAAKKSARFGRDGSNLPPTMERSIRTARETTQPDREALEYWASGLSITYLKGAFARALDPSIEVPSAVVATPHFDGPAPAFVTPEPVVADRAVMDPYSVAEKGETLLRQELGALHAWRLRDIARAYDLADPSLDLDALTEPELIDLIVAKVVPAVQLKVRLAE